MSAVQQPPQQTVFVADAPAPRPELAKGACLGLGVTQLVSGIVVLFFDLVIMVLNTRSGHLVYIYQGIWCGTTMIIAGSLGIDASRSQAHGVATGSAILSIFATILAFAGMCFAFAFKASVVVFAAQAASSEQFQFFKNFVALLDVQSMIFLAESGVAIAQSVVCLPPACSETQLTQTTGITTAPAQPNPGQVYYNPAPPQTVVVQDQPGAAPPQDRFNEIIRSYRSNQER